MADYYGAAELVVLESLRDPRWAFRTVSGISKQTGLDASVVGSVLKENPEIARKCNVLTGDGQTLYAHWGPPRTMRELLSLTRAYITRNPYTS